MLIDYDVAYWYSFVFHYYVLFFCYILFFDFNWVIYVFGVILIGLWGLERRDKDGIEKRGGLGLFKEHFNGSVVKDFRGRIKNIN